MGEKKYRYLSFLLRIWEVERNGETIWRASLECPGSRERFGFESLEKLFEFLLSQTELKTVIIEKERTISADKPGTAEKPSSSIPSPDDPGAAAAAQPLDAPEDAKKTEGENQEEIDKDETESKRPFFVPPISKYEGN